MDKIVTQNILVGRPYGGTGILMKSCYTNSIIFVQCKERFVVIGFNDLILVNLYLPSVQGDHNLELLQDVIADLDIVIDNAIIKINKVQPVFVAGGDLNVHLESNSQSSRIINEFIETRLLTSCHTIKTGNLNYTYCHETLQQYSLVDYFLINRLSDSNINLGEYTVIDDPINLSDHLPIKIKIDLKCFDSIKTNIINDNLSNSSNQFQHFNWKSCDKQAYYNATGFLCDPVYNKISRLFDKIELLKVNDSQVFKEYFLKSLCTTITDTWDNVSNLSIRSLLTDVDNVYNELVSVLQLASSETVPIKRESIEKCWWDEELSNLKSQSVITHDAWVSAGRPRSGPIFNDKMSAKRKYRNRIKQK